MDGWMDGGWVDGWRETTSGRAQTAQSIEVFSHAKTNLPMACRLPMRLLPTSSTATVEPVLCI